MGRAATTGAVTAGTELDAAVASPARPSFAARLWLPLGRRAPKVGGPEILSRRLQRELRRQTLEGESTRFCLRGDLGHALVCLDDRLIVLKAGFHAGTTFGAMAATIFYRDVTGIQVRMHLVSGWIEISSPSFQGRERKKTRHPRSSDRDVYKLPNCVPIHRPYLDEYAAPLAELRRLVAEAKDVTATQATVERSSVVAELERLSRLAESGQIDDDEYARAKALVLGEGVRPAASTPSTTSSFPRG